MKTLKSLLQTPGITFEPQAWGWLLRDSTTNKWLGSVKSLPELEALLEQMKK
jgi:hypothetical protein